MNTLISAVVIAMSLQVKQAVQLQDFCVKGTSITMPGLPSGPPTLGPNPSNLQQLQAASS